MYSLDGSGGEELCYGNEMRESCRESTTRCRIVAERARGSVVKLVNQLGAPPEERPVEHLAHHRSAPCLLARSRPAMT